MRIIRLGIWMTAILLVCGLARLKVFGQPLPVSQPGMLRSLGSQKDISGEITPAYIGCGGMIVPAVNEDYEQRVVELVNQARAEERLPPFKRTSSLVEAARYHAADMSMDGYFRHDTYDRSNSRLIFVCDTWSRILSYYFPDWRAMAENIAAGQVDPEKVVQNWLDSPGHRENILSPDTWETGVGYASGGTFAHYWVQDFGRRAGVFPIVINNEAAITETRDVFLYIFGDWQEMRLRNDEGDWSSWQPFRNRLNWTLNGEDGEHQVSVELRSVGQNASSSDSIILFEVSPTLNLVDLPEALSFQYGTTDDCVYPSKYMASIQSTYDSQILEWSALVLGEWFQVSPSSGETPQVISISPKDYQDLPAGIYNGQLTVTANEPGEVVNSSQTIQLTLLVLDQPMRQVFLPLAAYSY